MSDRAALLAHIDAQLVVMVRQRLRQDVAAMKKDGSPRDEIRAYAAWIRNRFAEDRPRALAEAQAWIEVNDIIEKRSLSPWAWPKEWVN